MPRLLRPTLLTLTALCLLLIPLSYTDLVPRPNTTTTLSLLRGRLWLAHLPDMPAAAIDAWWAAHGASDRTDLPALGPWPHRETVGPRGWAFALPLWIPLALFSLAAAAARFAPPRPRPHHTHPADHPKPRQPQRLRTKAKKSLLTP